MNVKLAVARWFCRIGLIALSQAAHAEPSCPLPLQRDPLCGLCTNGTQAFGPFPERLVRLCEREGGGHACHDNRWELAFTVSLVRQAPPWTPLGATREIRGVYVTHFALLPLSDGELSSLAQEMADRNVNTVFVSVFHEGEALWPSSAFAAVGGPTSTVNHVQRWSNAFHKKGLRFAAWFESGLRLGKPEHPVAQAHPDWLQRDKEGNAVGSESQTVFLSPGSPWAMSVVADMAAELASPATGVDEIQLDHFHWTFTRAGREMGYETATRNRYWDAHRRAAPENPDDEDWVAFRESLLDQAVRATYQKAKERNARIVVSTVPEASYTFTRHMKRWPRWLANGYIDSVLAQIYFTDPEMFRKELRLLSDEARNAGALDRFGYVVDAASNTPDQAEAMISFARSLGVHNTALWVYHPYSWGNPATWALRVLASPQRAWSSAARHPFSWETSNP